MTDYYYLCDGRSYEKVYIIDTEHHTSKRSEARRFQDWYSLKEYVQREGIEDIVNVYTCQGNKDVRMHANFDKDVFYPYY